MLTAKELYDFLDSRYPRSLSVAGDPDGMTLCPAPARPVKRVLVSLDITPSAVEMALGEKADLLLTHHPLLYEGVHTLHPFSGKGALLLPLAKAEISAFSFHTRLDCAQGGVNDCLAALLELTSLAPLYAEGQPLLRIGTLPSPLTAKALAKKLADLLHAVVTYSDGAAGSDGERLLRRVAVMGGSGRSGTQAALSAGADAFVTGELRYHELLPGAIGPMAVFCCGHYESEAPVLEELASAVKTADEKIEVLFCREKDFQYEVSSKVAGRKN